MTSTRAHARVCRADIHQALAEARSLIEDHVSDGENTRNVIALSEDRIVHSVERLLRLKPQPQNACEIGFGPVGLVWHLLTGRPLTGFDIRETYRPLCDRLGIPLHKVDLRQPGSIVTRGFDLAMMYEVIEHIDRPPAQLLNEIQKFLRPGGQLMLSTVNLTRLLNRLRLLLGRPIFADYHPDELVLAHFREYAREELERYINEAGFTVTNSYYFCQPDTRRARLLVVSYRGACLAFPKLSNMIFVEAIAAAP